MDDSIDLATILVGVFSFAVAAWLCRFGAKSFIAAKIFMVFCLIGVAANILSFLDIGGGKIPPPSMGSFLLGIGGLAGYVYGRGRQARRERE